MKMEMEIQGKIEQLKWELRGEIEKRKELLVKNKTTKKEKCPLIGKCKELVLEDQYDIVCSTEAWKCCPWKSA